VPLPDGVVVPVDAETVYAVPLPDTPVIAGVGPDSPEATSEKFDADTPVTLLLKVTVHWTSAALVGVALARLIDVTVGGVVSIVQVKVVVELVWLPDLANTRKVWLP
jgi:hypothetical protein